MNPHDVTSPTEEEMELDRLREENRKLREALEVGFDALNRARNWFARGSPDMGESKMAEAWDILSAALSQTKGGG